MNDKSENNSFNIETQSDPMMDTQWLLNMGTPAEGTTYAVDDILAEFGLGGAVQSAPENLPDNINIPDNMPENMPENVQLDAPEQVAPAVSQPEENAPDEETSPDENSPDENIPEKKTSPEGGENAPEIQPESSENIVNAVNAEMNESTDSPADSPSPPDPESAAEDNARGIQPPSVQMEDIENLMAHTVDAVKEEQEIKQEIFRKKLEKARKAVSRRFQKKDPRRPVPDADNEPPPIEPAQRNKRRWQDCKRSLRLAALVTFGLWSPWVLTQFGVTVPFFSDSSDNAALCVLIPQALVTIIGWPVFRAAIEHLKEGAWSIYTTASLCTVVTLLDEMTLLLLPERTDAAPLGGLAAVLMLFALWGLCGTYRGHSESMRTAAMGEPARLVDRCGETVAKGAGGRRGFYTRLTMEDSSAQWQRLLLPVLAVASFVFAALSSVGRDQPQNFLWCWSVILCAASPLTFPMAYSVPFGRLAARLARSGAAVAGQYGAAVLASSRRLAVTDEDLFPQHTAALGGWKPYGEERNAALSYVASLTARGGGTLGRVFGEVCQNERISLHGVEHFHIHDDGGLSGIINGETVLVGNPTFMRHKAVRLPGSTPAKTSVCLAVDGELRAVFIMKYNANDTVEYGLRAMRRNGMQIMLATRDCNVGPKLLKERFGINGNVLFPELSERLNLSDPEREAEGPSGIMYREGLLPFAALAVGSGRLCQTAFVGNLLAVFSGIAGALLGFYLTFNGTYDVLTPPLLLTYMALWVAPMAPLVWTVDKL